MPPIHYPIKSTAVYRGAGHDACRRAVLWPIVGRYLQGQARRSGVDYNKPKLPEAYPALHEAWRRRIQTLAANGWAAAKASPNFGGNRKEDKRSAGYRYVCLTNCPPFSVAVPSPRGTPCQQARVCPMCYARRVVMELYKAVEWAFFGDTGRAVRGKTRLVAVRRTFDVLESELGLEGWLERMRRQRMADVNRVERERGHAVLMTLEPGTDVRLRLRRTSFVIVPKGVDLDGIEKDGKKKVLEPDEVTREEIGRLVAWGAAYPTGMMFGDAKRAAEICNLTAELRARMFVPTGLLRNKQSRPTPKGPRQAVEWD